MHFAQSTLRTMRPSSSTLTVCRFGLNVRRVAFLDQGRLRPKVVFLPQCAHFAILVFLSEAILLYLLPANPVQSLPGMIARVIARL